MSTHTYFYESIMTLYCVVVLLQLLCMNVSPIGGLGVCSSVEGKLWVWDTDNGNTRVCVLLCEWWYWYEGMLLVLV